MTVSRGAVTPRRPFLPRHRFVRSGIPKVGAVPDWHRTAARRLPGDRESLDAHRDIRGGKPGKGVLLVVHQEVPERSFMGARWPHEYPLVTYAVEADVRAKDFGRNQQDSDPEPQGSAAPGGSGAP